MFDNNLGKCLPIFKILSPIDSCENSLCVHTTFRRIVTLLIIAPYKYSYLLTYLLTYLRTKISTSL